MFLFSFFFLIDQHDLQPTYFIWFNAESILLLLKQDPEVAHLAAVYLRWVSIGLPGKPVLLAFFGSRAALLTPFVHPNLEIRSLRFQLHQPVSYFFDRSSQTLMLV